VAAELRDSLIERWSPPQRPENPSDVSVAVAVAATDLSGVRSW